MVEEGVKMLREVGVLEKIFYVRPEDPPEDCYTCRPRVHFICHSHQEYANVKDISISKKFSGG